MVYGKLGSLKMLLNLWLLMVAHLFVHWWCRFGKSLMTGIAHNGRTTVGQF